MLRINILIKESNTTTNPANNPKNRSGGMFEINAEKNATAVVKEVRNIAEPATESVQSSRWSKSNGYKIRACLYASHIIKISSQPTPNTRNTVITTL